MAVQSEIIQQKRAGIISIMATFPDIKPSYGARKTNAPDFRVVRFADGYEHRIIFGLPANQNPKLFNFTWNVSESDADTIEDFLDARGGTESFDYTPAGERVLLKNLFARLGQKQFHILTELQLMQHLEKFLSHEYSPYNF